MTESKMRVLALDDDPDSAELIAKIANRCGCEGRSVTSTSRLCELLKDWQPDVLTLDLCMPGEDGIEVLSMLQQIRFGGRVVIITGQDRSLGEVACELAAMRGINIVTHLRKPIDATELKGLLTSSETTSGGGG